MQVIIAKSSSNRNNKSVDYENHNTKIYQHSSDLILATIILHDLHA